jgi:SulP family sulfate permease
LTVAIGTVPDGMAAGVLAGVNPVYGLYAGMAAPIAGGLLTSTELMVVTTTNAAAIAAGQALTGLDGAAREEALFLMIVLIGAIQIAAGLLRLGSLTRFVSHSVMTGFLSGIAVLIILGQLGTFAGYAPQGANRVAQALNLLLNVRSVDPWSVATGVLTMGLALTLPRTRLGTLGTVLALAVPSAMVAVLGWDSVKLVADTGTIPRGLPVPQLPRLTGLPLETLLSVATTSLAVAAVVLVQGAGVSQGASNPDGRRSDPSRDFFAQGVANVASGLFRGLPVGGSMGSTSLNVTAGGRTRWAAIFAGVWMLLIVVLIPGLVGRVAMPALAALLILAALNAIRVDESLSIWHTGWASRLAILVTFGTTLFLPIPAAIAAGAGLSAILYIYSASSDISLVELVTLPDGRVEERPPPAQLPGDAVTVLGIYGSLFYAGAWTLERLLPAPQGATRAVVVLRLRGWTRVGATFVDVIARYAARLAAGGGRLYLSGVDAGLAGQLQRTGKVNVDGPVDVYAASGIVLDSTRRASAAATAWLVAHRPEATPLSSA